MTLYRIKILKPFESNPRHKKTMIPNNFFEDSILNSIPRSHSWLYCRLLMVSSDISCDTVTVTEQYINNALGTRVGCANALHLLQSFQLVTFEIIPSPFIYKRKKNNRIERKEDMSVSVSPTPTPLSLESPFDPQPKPKPGLHWLAEIWNREITSLPKVKATADKRLERISKLVKVHPSEDYWVQVVKKIEASDFLSGRNGAWTGCNFDWLLGANKLGVLNHERVDEGVHDNKRKTRNDMSPEFQQPAGYYDTTGMDSNAIPDHFFSDHEDAE